MIIHIAYSAILAAERRYRIVTEKVNGSGSIRLEINRKHVCILQHTSYYYAAQYERLTNYRESWYRAVRSDCGACNN